MARILYRLDLLSRRERLLLLALVWMALPLALAIGVILPVTEARRAAVAQVAQAEALHRWVVSQAEALPPDAVRTQSAMDENTGPIGISRIEQTLISAGLRQRIARLANRPDNGVEIGFDPVAFGQLTGWLDTVMGSWGYSISEFRVERSDAQGLVTAGIVLEARR